MRRLLSLVVLVVSLTAICGNLTGIAKMYRWTPGSNTAGMALNTALCLLAIAIYQLTERDVR